MAEMILPFQGGHVTISDEEYCSFKINIEGYSMNFGYFSKHNVLDKMLDRMINFYTESSSMENDKEYQLLTSMFEPHAFACISRSFRKITFYPYNCKENNLYEVVNINGKIPNDFEHSTFIIELSDDDYQTWIQELTKALPTAKDTSYI